MRKQATAAVLFSSFMALCFAACSGGVSLTFEGHPVYEGPVVDDGSGPPPDATGVGCDVLADCDFWLCGCSDGTVVAGAGCTNGFCLDADGLCPTACDVLGHGGFAGDATGGPGSGIGGPGDIGGGGAGGGGDCAVDGDGCGADEDCCSGICTADGSCGEGCVADGDGCGFDDECCSGVCGSDGTCGGDSTTCSGAGDACDFDDECCSGVCDTSYGTCQ